MTSPILHLSTEELWSALDDINPVDVLVEQLIGGAGWTAQGQLHPWPEHGSIPSAELAMYEESCTGAKCLIPVSSLRQVRAAALATLAARELLAPGVVTAAVLGSGLAAQLQLTVLAKHVSDVSHVAVCAGNDGGWSPVEPRVLDQLDLAGIGLSVTSGVNEAVLGANLVIAADAGLGRLEIGQLAKGAVVINAGGVDLPDAVVDGVDQVYVDDASLLDENSHRYFVTMHRAAQSTGPHRQKRFKGWHRRRLIEADLGALLSGSHTGRQRLDDVVLVELLSTNLPDAHLTARLHRAALDRGLGMRVSGS
ncbi:Ornithine cyclodeaminase/mu-crystallin family protein [Amycolatopsis xylanica]|uniref:Ornithine cyclodeaminase/mu-crystallin family protein n=1 Tax=Amycolatopsis xylanica TaxID=589385 RepID=A0A1H3NK70_9PSEU|nr:hypothetical protein [Amycolatopsis xylanica]SDY89208.1 Ornithine cyclodeaminase/mu-crystallin family protein [Amycolatopsis xylanica]